MGIIIAKFRKKKTTEEVLEKLDKEIKSIELYGKDTEQSKKKIVGRFLLISVIVYIGTALLFYFYFFPSTLYDRIWYIIPLLLAPVIIITAKKGLTFYYSRRISRNQVKLKQLNDDKKKILEKVMETETYKVAKVILEKYAPEQTRKTHYPAVSTGDNNTPNRNNSLQVFQATTGLRHRPVQPHLQPTTSQRGSTANVFQTPSRPIMSIAPTTAPKTSINSLPVVPSNAVSFAATPLPLPRSILPRERSVFDKMVEYLVGDGPSNRFALICKYCSSHNGMALKEEFEYLSFRCCYCYAFNPARKKRPLAPKLEFHDSTIPAIKDIDTSESEKNSESESDADESDHVDGHVEKIEGKQTPEGTTDNESAAEKDSEEKLTKEPVPMDVDTDQES